MPASYPDFPHHSPDRGLLRRLRRPLRLPRPDHVRDAGRAGGAAGRRALGGEHRPRRDAHLRRAGRRQRPPLGPALARAPVPGPRALRGRAAPLARLQGRRPRVLPRQVRRRARDGQLGDGHRGRGLVRGARHVPRRAARRLRDPEVHLRPAAGHPGRVAADPVRAAPARAGEDAAGASSATWSATACRSPTTASARRIRRSPTTRSRASRTARSTPKPNIEELHGAHACGSPTAARSTPTSSSTAPATRSRSRSSTRS